MRVIRLAPTRFLIIFLLLLSTSAFSDPKTMPLLGDSGLELDTQEAHDSFKNATAPLADPILDPEERFLRALFASFNGEAWADRTGWLEPGVHWCDWHGVQCGLEPPRLNRVLLRENGLSGEFSDELAALLEANKNLPVFDLDLSRNEISGSIPLLPRMINFINLSENQLSGPLPDILPRQDPDEPFARTLWRLDLSDNLLSGPIPSNWPTSVSLFFLDLSNNALEGSLENAVRSMADYIFGRSENDGLWVSDNLFSGVMEPEWFVDVELDVIDLCRTNIIIEDPALDQWIAERHWGGDQDLCLHREQFAIDPTISGSWFDPSRPGEGFSVILLDSGVPLVYWFSHVSFNGQFWIFNTGSRFDSHLVLAPALRTRGRYGLGFDNIEYPVYRGADVRMDRVESSLLHVELGINYSLRDVLIPPYTVIGTPFPIPDVGFRSDHLQLSRLAGTTCENQQQTQWMSGAWFDPERSGEGFVVEVIEGGRGVVYWFSYNHRDDGQEPILGNGQAWMTGDGQIVGNTLTIDPLYRPIDTESAMPFDIEGVINEPIGRLELHFDDDMSGHVDFISTSTDFPSLDYPIQRLARPMLAECP